MTVRLTNDQARVLRMSSNGLLRRAAEGEASARVVAAVDGCAGVQAQDLVASQLAVRARAEAVIRQDVVDACTSGSVVRSWFMRGTLHMVPAGTAGWLTTLLGPLTIAKYRGRRASLGLDDQVCAAASAALPQILSRGPLERAQLVAALRASGVNIDPRGQAPAHLVLYAASLGLIRRGPDNRTEPTYVLVDHADDADRADPSEAAAELARWYFSAFGPATVEDFTAWSGLSASRARTAVGKLAGGEFAEAEVGGRTMWLPAGLPDTLDDCQAGVWRLLPAFDTFLVAYRDRELLINPASAKQVYAGGGWIHPAVLRDGMVVGTWRLRRQGGDTAVEVALFDDRDRAAELDGEISDVRLFFGDANPGRLVVGGVDHHRRGVMAVDAVEDAGEVLELAAEIVVQV
ncbi:MAG TPA: winged helix DNA-binding domain-containing protein [Streptosporangiaceae bacterium]|nr:winged helix DNA-binding domain-containing protein [Streptosporangiaceae bacterium]